jgi:hypothetical protein
LTQGSGQSLGGQTLHQARQLPEAVTALLHTGSQGIEPLIEGHQTPPDPIGGQGKAVFTSIVRRLVWNTIRNTLL